MPCADCSRSPPRPWQATFTDKGNDPAFSAKVLPSGTISKLDQPDAAVKKITQPFATFGGRGQEASTAFYTRVSERLRHKDRAIALWDYERLVLEAFPQIYQVKCLNHTHYEPRRREFIGNWPLATSLSSPFRTSNLITNAIPYNPTRAWDCWTNISAFLSRRLSCFVKLHVKNPLV